MQNRLTEHTVKQKDGGVGMENCNDGRKSIKMYSKWRKSTVLVKLQQYVYFVASQKIVGMPTDELGH